MFDYSKVLSKTVLQMKPSGIRRFFDLAEEMEDVVSLSIGEPGFVTPERVRKAAIDALNAGHTHYSANTGIGELKQEIASYVNRKFNLTYDKSEIIVTVGASEAIDISMRALLEPGDEVIVPEPCFVSYAPTAELCGAKVVRIQTLERDSFRLTPEQLRAAITPKTKILMLSYPNNPTGAVMYREHLEAIAEVLRGTDIIVLSDEIYAELTYGRKHASFADIPDMRERTIFINGFSKAFAMTGWRLGFACAPAPMMKEIMKVHQYALMCAPTPAQYAAVEALRNGEEDVRFMADQYDTNRKLIYSELHRIGLPCFEPEGAFYIFPNITSTGLTSEQFCTDLLVSQKVAVVPGTAFGDCGEGFVRMAYAQSLENVAEAMKRIEIFLNEIRK